MADDGSGGYGGIGSGNPGGGGEGSGSGSDGAGGGGEKWSLLSWYMALLGKYLYLSKLVTLPSASGAFLRLLLDQFLFAPTFIGVFLSTLATLEGKPSQVIPKLQQVLAANVIPLIWNVILSYKAHKEVIQK